MSDSASEFLCELAGIWFNYSYAGGKSVVVSTGLSWLRTGSCAHDKKRTFGFYKSSPPVGFPPVKIRLLNGIHSLRQVLID